MQRFTRAECECHEDESRRRQHRSNRDDRRKVDTACIQELREYALGRQAQAAGSDQRDACDTVSTRRRVAVQLPVNSATTSSVVSTRAQRRFSIVSVACCISSLSVPVASLTTTTPYW